MSIVRKLAKALIHIFSLFTKTQDIIVFVPHENCENDRYDIINYSSDNALCLFNSIIRDLRFDKYELVVFVYDLGKVQQYKKYCHIINARSRVRFVNAHSKKDELMVLLKCRICLTTHPQYDYSYFKKKSQTIISLGYFTPFKNDYTPMGSLPFKEKLAICEKVNKSFDYHISTSDISSRILSVDTFLSYSKFLPLGFPRNDIFYSVSVRIKNELEKLMGFPIDKIITYTPTYRDYESNDSNEEKHTIFSCGREDEEKLQGILVNHNAILIAKLHPLQEKSVFVNNNLSRIVFFSEVANRIQMDLYELLNETDVLITDYTSTAFDFLHSSRCIIYYMYDLERYQNTRGVSLNPYESLCAGNIVHNMDSLSSHIQRCLTIGADDCESKRQYVHSLFNLYHDNHASDRIKNMILN